MNTDVHIKLKLYIKLTNDRCFIEDASLVSEGLKYRIIAKIKSKDARAFSLRSKYWNDNMLTLNLNKEFSVYKAYLDGKSVKVRLNDARLVGMHSKHLLHQDYTTYVWEISSFVYEMNNEKNGNINEIRYYLTRNSNGILVDNKIKETFIYKKSTYSLFADEDDNVYIRTTIRQEDIADKIVNEILLLLSFYLRTPIEYRMKHIVNGKEITFKYNHTKYNIQETYIIHSQFLYLNIQCGENLADFIKSIEGGHIEDVTFEFIGRGIDNYIRSNFLDNVSKYILLYSVLAAFAHKIHSYNEQNEYKSIKKLTDNFNLDISLLDSDIKTKKFNDSNGKRISNFAHLRNEIMHGLPSAEINRFLDDESDIISKMEFMTVIIILKELGFSDISFIKGFDNLSVFKKVDKDKDRDTKRESCLLLRFFAKIRNLIELILPKH